MREILFKAKSIESGEWEIGSYRYGTETAQHFICLEDIAMWNNERELVIREINIDPSTVCQFTGLLDSKGVKIFEGDSMENIHKKYTVKFNDGAFWMVDESTGADNWENIRDCTITGNIHDKEQDSE